MVRPADLAERPNIRIGPLTVSASRRLLSGPAGEAHLEPRTMQVFLLLLDAIGSVVTRQQIFDECWSGAMVGDDSINRAIAQIRKALEQTAPGAFEVETIPRTGYRLTGAGFDEQIEANGVESSGGRGIKRDVSRRMLLAGGAAGLLASVGLWTALRPSTDRRFTELLDQGHQILRHEYSDRRLAAIPLLQQALAIHPDNPEALGLIAYARALSATNIRPSATEVAAADRAIRAALAADANDSHAQLALLLFQRNGLEWAATEDGLRRILQRSPRDTLTLNWLVALYQAAGRNQLSWEVNEEALQIDPISPVGLHRKALKHWIFGRTDEAYRLIDRLITVWPRHPWVWNARFLIFAFTGRAHAALDMIEDDGSRPQNVTPAAMAQWRPSLAALENPTPAANTAARQANLAAARQSPGQAAYAVMALSGIGEIDAAYEVAEGFLLSRGAIVTRNPTDSSNMLVNTPTWRNTQWLSTPPLARFRSDPRFATLCDGIGLTNYWRIRGVAPDYPRAAVA